MDRDVAKIYEDFMLKLLCPSSFKKFSLKNLNWLKEQVSDKRIPDALLRAEIRSKIAEIESLLSER